jgi:hypothetical protein
MRYSSFIFMAAALVAPATAQTVQIADGNWSSIPRMIQTDTVELSQATMAKIDTLVAKGKCARIGRKNKVNLDVPFLLQFKPNGVADQIVVKRIGCPEVEQVLAGVAVAFAKSGKFRPTGENQTGWYRSEISYHLE